jgi:hypothetical protein
MFVLYANSSDGLSWTKPDLGLVDVGEIRRDLRKHGEGGIGPHKYLSQKNNNIVMRGMGVGIILDAQEKNKSQRFKAFGGGAREGACFGGTCVAPGGTGTSADGLHWNEAVKVSWPLPHGYDTHNNIIWDERNGTYLLTTRSNMPWRVVALARSAKGEFHWDTEESPPVVQPNGMRADWRTALATFGKSRQRKEPYSQITFIWPGMETQVYLGIVSVLDIKEGTIHCRLSWSKDASNWQWVDPGGLAGRDFIPVGEKGAFDSHICFAAAHPVAIPGTGVRMYYMGGDGTHENHKRNTSLGLATLGTDRYAGLSGSGSVTTTALNCTGNALTITADVMVGGSVLVGVIDTDGLSHVFASRITGNVTDHQIVHKSLSGLIGTDVKISIELHRAVVYTVGFTQAPGLALAETDETNIEKRKSKAVTGELEVDSQAEMQRAMVADIDDSPQQALKFIRPQVSWNGHVELAAATTGRASTVRKVKRGVHDADSRAEGTWAFNIQEEMVPLELHAEKSVKATFSGRLEASAFAYLDAYAPRGRQDGPSSATFIAAAFTVCLPIAAIALSCHWKHNNEDAVASSMMLPSPRVFLSPTNFCLLAYLGLLLCSDILANAIAQKRGGWYPWHPSAVIFLSELSKGVMSMAFAAGGMLWQVSAPTAVRDNVDEQPNAAASDSTVTTDSKQFLKIGTEAALRLLPIAAIYSANNCLVLFVLSRIQLSSFVVWRNSSIVFNAILWTIYFNKKFHIYKSFGVLAFLVGLTLISIRRDGAWEPFTRPMFLVLGSCFLSASASVLNEGVLKHGRLNKLGINVINIILYVESSCILLAALCFQSWRANLSLRGEFQNIDSSAISLVVVQMTLGLVVSRVLLHADSVAKVMVGGAREVMTLLIAPVFVASRADWIATSAGLWVAFAMFVYFTAPTKNENRV